MNEFAASSLFRKAKNLSGFFSSQKNLLFHFSLSLASTLFILEVTGLPISPISSLVSLVFAASNPWTQTNWVGGSGQTSWSATNMFDSSSSVTTSVADQITLTATSNWYNSAWTYRKKISFNNVDQAENLTDFPVLIKLTSSNFDFSRAKSAGEDIRVTDSDGTALLSYEIEKWDTVASEAAIWVKVPQIDASSGTDNVYLYYGNAAATDSQSVNATWGNTFTSVWHLKESGNGTASEYVDSTSNSQSGRGGGGTASQVPTASSSAKIGTGQTFSTDDYIEIPSESTYDFENSTFTVSGWFLTTNTTQQVLIGKNSNGSSGGWLVDMSANKLRGQLKGTSGGTAAQRATATSYNNGAWHHFTIVFTTNSSVAASNDVSIYVDGVLDQGSLTNDGSTYLNVSQAVNIGRRGGNTAYFAGVLDELRVSNVSRSAPWIAANYKNNTDTFNTFAAEEQQIASLGTLTSSVFDTEQNSNWGTLTYSVTTPANTTASVKVRTASSADMTGATAFSSCTAISSGADISANSCVSDIHRYVQYQLTLTNTNQISTPTFTSFSLTYSQAATPVTYYFDSVSGSDSNTGTSSGQPWQTVSKFNSTTFNPGDTILFKRGGIWDGGLVISESGASGNPITLSDYGTGTKPIFRDTSGDQYERAIEILGDYITVQNAKFDDATYSAIQIFEGATHNTVLNSDFSNVGIGVTIKGDDNTVSYSTFADLAMVRNTEASSCGNCDLDDYGALAVNINAAEEADDQISNITISYNNVIRAEASSYDYGTDGGFVEVFGAVDTINIYGNQVRDSKGFIEIGSPPSENGLAENIYIYNNISLNNDGKFMFVNSGLYASEIENIVVQNNTLYESETTTSPFFFDNGTPGQTDFVLRNNIMYARSQFVNCNGGCSPSGNFPHTNNIYTRITGSTIGFSLGSGEVRTDASFVSTASGSYDLRLRPESVAINAGYSTGYTEDLYRTTRPQGSSIDIGVYEVSVASAPASLAQYQNDGSTAITTGAWYTANSPVLKFEVSSYNPQDSLIPKVEVKTIGTSFNGSSLTTGTTMVASGSAQTASITMSNLPDGQYHWRASNTNGIGTSSYLSFGGNAESAADFGIDVTAPVASSMSINSGDASIATTAATLTLSASDATSGMADVIYSESSSFTGASWVTYATSKSFTLSTGTGTKTVYVKFRDVAGNESSTISDTISYEAANVSPNVPASLGPTAVIDGSFSTDNTPAFSFVLSDLDSSDTVKYQIQIDDTSDFSSPVVDYTSSLAAQGSAVFTVGQAAGSGGYTTGSASQTLTSGSYYWQVRTIDNSFSASAYTVANSGSIAFKIDVVAPNAPTNLLIASPRTTGISASWTAATDALSGIAHYAWRILNSVGAEIYSGTTGTLSVIQSLAEGTWTFFVGSVDNAGNESAEISSEFVVDPSVASFTNVTAGSLTSTSASITWTTDDSSTSRVLYGVGTGSFSLSTALADVATRVSSHTLALSSLEECTRYGYQVESINEAGSAATSSATAFTTEGCLGSSEVEDQSQGAVTESAGGTVTHAFSGGDATLVAPANYSTDDTYFQIKRIDTTEVIQAAPEPTSFDAVSGYTFDFSALTSSGVAVTTFDEPITITIEYSDSVANSYTESSLYIGHWSGTAWDTLSDCSNDTNANTVSCTTTSFSAFALFGTPSPATSTSSSSGSSGSSGSSSSDSSSPQGCADSAPASAPYLYEIRRYGTSAELYFTPVNPLTEYYVAYGTKADQFVYGLRWEASPTNGAVKVMINSLDAKQPYTFKVRGGNGCRPGDWSNALTISVSRFRGWASFFPNRVSAPAAKDLTTIQKKVSSTVTQDAVTAVDVSTDKTINPNVVIPDALPNSGKSADYLPQPTSQEIEPSGFFGWIRRLFRN